MLLGTEEMGIHLSPSGYVYSGYACAVSKISLVSNIAMSTVVTKVLLPRVAKVSDVAIKTEMGMCPQVI